MRAIVRTMAVVPLLLALSCSKREPRDKAPSKRLSASAVAVSRADGTVEARNVDALPPEVDAEFDQMFRLEEKHPAEPPKDATEHEVARVVAGNQIVLDSGQVARLAGVEVASPSDDDNVRHLAAKHGVSPSKVREYARLSGEYLARLAMDKNTRVIVDPIGPAPDSDVIIGYVWLCDYSLMRDPEMKGIVTGPSYTCVNEAALSSGWAFFDDKADHPMSQKYGALQEMAKSGRVGVWEDRGGDN